MFTLFDQEETTRLFYEEVKGDAQAEGRAEGQAEGQAEGRAEGQIESIRALVSNMDIDAHKAMELLNIPSEEQDKLEKLL